MHDSQSIELSIPNELGCERFAMSCSALYAERLGFKADRIEDLKTAVAEACINAIQHGNKEKVHERVLVRMSRTNESFMVVVIDKGTGFKGALPKDPDIDRIVMALDPPKGFGLFLIKNLVDAFEFNHHAENGHAVKLYFNLP
jgi:serine/threonine-protein kinase RsbW